MRFELLAELGGVRRRTRADRDLDAAGAELPAMLEEHEGIAKAWLAVPAAFRPGADAERMDDDAQPRAWLRRRTQGRRRRRGDRRQEGSARHIHDPTPKLLSSASHGAR